MARRTIAARFNSVQPALALAAAGLDEDVTLAALSARARLSPFHLHRMFAAVAGETPKQFTLRLRLSRAAALLLSSGDSVLNIALSCGFMSHETFTRAFRRRFGMTPRAYRARGFAGGASIGEAASHAAVVSRVGPCVGLFHVRPDGAPQRSNMSYSIEKKDLAPQPVLVVRRRIKRSEIAATIGAVLPQVFEYAQQRGVALSGHPFARYSDVGPGLMTIEPGMRVAGPGQLSSAPGDAARQTTSGEGGVVEDILPGGPAATTIHAGSYESLSDAYAALESWMESQGLQSAGAPWESYITDPGEVADPKDWRTEVCWPVR
jgi:AraC family transcriptional regulator